MANIPEGSAGPLKVVAFLIGKSGKPFKVNVK